MRGRGSAGSVPMKDSRGRDTRRGHSSSSATTSIVSASTPAPLGTETVGQSTSTFAGPCTFTTKKIKIRDGQFGL